LTSGIKCFEDVLHSCQHKHRKRKGSICIPILGRTPMYSCEKFQYPWDLIDECQVDAFEHTFHALNERESLSSKEDF